MPLLWRVVDAERMGGIAVNRTTAAPAADRLRMSEVMMAEAATHCVVRQPPHTVKGHDLRQRGRVVSIFNPVTR